MLLSFIGPPVDANAGFSTYEQPVIAQLEADGSGRWWSLPEGWTLAASDVFGTVVQRTTSNGIELARFPDDDSTTPAAPDASITEVDVQPRTFPLGVTSCDPQQGQSCSADSLADGRLLVHRASTDSLITIDSDGRQQERPLRPSLSGYMIAVDPDDVVFLTTGNGETAGDIVAYRHRTRRIVRPSDRLRHHRRAHRVLTEAPISADLGGSAEPIGQRPR